MRERCDRLMLPPCVTGCEFPAHIWEEIIDLKHLPGPGRFRVKIIEEAFANYGVLSV